jgi:predicted dehydrogenase
MGNTHTRGWQKIDDAEIVAYCDVDGQRAADMAQQNGGAEVFTDFRKAVKFAADVIDVCVPNNAHMPTVLAALAAGKHVLCEKPLAVLPRQVERMMAARDKAKKMLMTAQHMRFLGPSQALKNYVAQGHLGDIYYARTWHNRRRGLPNWGVFAQKEFSGGGPCVDLGVHNLDLTLWLMDNFEPVSVSGIAPCKLASQKGIYNRWGPINHKEIDVEDFAAGFIRFKNGAALSLEASWMLNTPEQSMIKTWLFGTKAGAAHPDLTIAAEHDQVQVDTTITNAPQLNGHEEEIRAFFDAVTNGKKSPVPAEQSLQVIKVLDGIYRSHKLGREVKI